MNMPALPDLAAIDERVRTELVKAAADSITFGGSRMAASELIGPTGLSRQQVEAALARLAAAGMVERLLDLRSDGALRALWGIARARGYGGQISGARQDDTGGGLFLAQTPSPMSQESY